MAQEYINLEEALSRIGGNKTLFRRLLSMFDKSTEFDKFEAALAEGDLQKAADGAHTIKGLTGNLSMTVLFEASAKLMNELRQNICDSASLAEYRDALEKTRARVAELEAELS